MYKNLLIAICAAINVDAFYTGDDYVVELTGSAFRGEVLDESNPAVWMVEFFAPWCGHCKALTPEWKKAARELDGIAKVGAVDCTSEQSLCQEYSVQGYPTIKVFHPETSAEDYQGARSADAIVEFAKSKADVLGYAKKAEVKQVADQAMLENDCLRKKLICVIFLVPHVYDTGAEGRNQLITMFNTIASSSLRQRVAFMWAVGGEHGKFERGFGIASNYPTYIAINEKKKLYATHKGSFDQAGISQGLNRLFQGRATFPIPQGKIPELSKNVPLWDGKDYNPDGEEE